ncbi:hypothetical protein SLA2020_349620 [Shorea laevis]
MLLQFVAATQPINSIAFVFDGINFGVSDFAYTAYSMVLVAGVSIVSLFFLPKSNGFVGIWIALTIYMILRMFAATQPINSIAFVFDGINFGASDFAYTAYSMVLVAGVSIGSLFFLSKSNGFVGIWIALTIYMILRMFAGVWRMGTGTGPWSYLRK